MKLDVLCFCQCCCDIIFAGLNALPSAGKEEYCKSLAMCAGGGANTAMGLARLGSKAGIITDIGTDALGALLLSSIAQSGVDLGAIKQTKDTAVSAVLSLPAERSFASYAGEEGFFRSEKELADKIKQARHVHSYVGYATAFDLPRLCKENGATLSLDVSATDLQNLQLMQAIASCTVLKANEEEACAIAKASSAQKALSYFANICPHALITLGEKGAIASINGKIYECSAPKVNAIDPTGAGDLFFAGYLHAWLSGLSAQESLEIAVLAGAIAVTQLGGAGEHFNMQNIEGIRKERHNI